MSYRKALEHDSTFLVGKSVLARLTLDLEERLALYKTIEEEKHTVTGEERLILDVYSALTKYTNLRDQKSPETKSALQDAFDIGEKNFRKIVHTYPDEVYLKSEYIEILHSKYGAAQSLDSLKKLSTIDQQTNPFLLGFKAILTAETKNYEEALKYLVARDLDIYLIHVLSQEEIDPDITGDLKLIDCEDQDFAEISVSQRLIDRYKQTLATFIEQARDFSSRRGIVYTMTSTERSVDRLFSRYLRQRELVR